MNKIMIVSNRLPITVTETKEGYDVQPSAGGLATALKSVASDGQMTWVGWPGCFPKKKNVAKLKALLETQQIVPVLPAKADFDGFYEDYANGVLWPVSHYLIERVPLQPSGFREYQKVNRMFADTVIANWEPGTKIWVHDYQLMLLPQLIRNELPEADIGFFMHIPFPSYEVFRTIPESRELLRGLMGADLIGFHTRSYVRHFKSAVSRILGEKALADGYQSGGRLVRAEAFPIGIDFDFFDGGETSAPCSQKINAMKEAAPGMKLFLAVDRLDYTKGVIRRLIAFEQMLRDHPDVLRRVVLVQVAVKTREHVKEYAKFKKQVDEFVGRINGEFGDVDYQPVHYIAHGLPQTELASLYKIADVMLVTPIRDGMNLVAKEYAAAKSDEDGVVVLSEFAGAAEEMAEALIVNPYDVQSTAKSMYKAFIMDEGERRLRMHSLRDRIRSWQSSHWAASFVRSLFRHAIEGAGDANEDFLSDRDVDALAHRCASEEEVVLLLDYDGTLVPIASTPDRAVPDPLLLDSLQRLSELKGVDVHIVSGRRREDLEAWFSDLTINLHGEHGVWKRPRYIKAWESTVAENSVLKQQLLAMAESASEDVAGSFVEEKTFGLSWHYRLSDPQEARERGARLRDEVQKRLGREVVVIPGKEVIEFQPRDVSKGSVARQIASDNPGRLVVALGDDVSDEEMFARLGEHRVSIHVGSGRTCADQTVRGVEAVRRFLGKFIDYRHMVRDDQQGGRSLQWTSVSSEIVTTQH